MLQILILCTCCWSLYYTLLRIFNKTSSPELNAQVVAFTHVLLVVPASGFCLWLFFVEVFHQGNTSCQINVHYFSLSYFIFETIWCCMYMEIERFVIGHFSTLAGLSTSLYLECYGYACMLILFELGMENLFIMYYR